jgi:hypothetical protein
MASGVGNQGGFTAALFITPPKVDQLSNESETNSNFKNSQQLNAISSIKRITNESPKILTANHISASITPTKSQENTIFSVF